MASSAPSGNEFVLDDGLDDDVDEDLLAFQSDRAAATEAAEVAAITPAHRPDAQKAPPPPVRESPPAAKQTVPSATTQQPIPALALALGPAADAELLISGLPVGCTRADVEALVGTGSLRAIRLGPATQGRYGGTVVVASAEGAARALELHRPSVRGTRITITSRGAGEKIQDALRDATAKLPLQEWAAAAERAQEDAGATLEKWDRQYALTARAEAATASVAGAATWLGDVTGVSRGASAVASAAAVAAKEVDENWHVSERARAAVNGALQNERLAPAARAVVNAVEPKGTPSRKDYRPSAERRNPELPVERDDGDPVAKLEF